MRVELANLDQRFQPWADWLLAVAQLYTGGATVTSTRRSPHEQAQLYQRYAGVQVCPVGRSLHELGLAVDVVVAAGSGSEAQAWLGAVWNHFCFPGAWSPADPVHFAIRRGCA